MDDAIVQPVAAGMGFTEKLDQLTRDLNKSDVAREAGLPATAVSDYLQKGYIPRADKALAIARAVNVPLEWLADPEQGWPPPSSAPAAPIVAAGESPSRISDALEFGLRLLNEIAALRTELAAVRRELAASRVAAMPAGEAGKEEYRRRVRLLEVRAEKIGPNVRICRFCGKALSDLPSHYAREHKAAIESMPAEAFT